MGKKRYAKCNILYIDEDVYDKGNFEILVEYKPTVNEDENGKRHIVFVGKDLITGTPFISGTPSEACNDISVALDRGLIKKGYLTAYNFKGMDRSKVAEKLQSMSEEDAKKYVKKVEEIKSIYSSSIISYETIKKEYRLSERLYEDTIRSELKRIKDMVRRLIKYKQD